MKNSKRLLAMAISAALAAPMAAHATNGMNLEAYGPIAGGMGGASMAYDNGNAAMMNNPATLGLGADGNRLDVALGHLGIDITVDGPAGSGMSWDSDQTGYFMPAVGWSKKSGDMVYGVGMYAQGGMGTEYNAGDMGTPGGAMSSMVTGDNIDNITSMAEGWLTSNGLPTTMFVHNEVQPTAADWSTMVPADVRGSVMAEVMQLDEMSEVSVGRLVVPFTKNINSKFSVGGSIDFVWAGMDLQMAMPGDMMADMMMGTQAAGSISGSLVDSMGSMMMPQDMFDTIATDLDMANFGTGAWAPNFQTYQPMVSGLNYGYVDFADSSPYTGKAQGNGFAGKLGFTYKVSPKVTVGGAYHSKTSMGDLKASGAKMDMSVIMTQIDTTTLQTLGVMTANTGSANINMSGDVAVKDFQWPDTLSLGVSYKHNDKLMLNADVKQINWNNVMADFTMEYTATSIMMGGVEMIDNAAAGSPFVSGSTTMTMSMKQDWENQTVIAIGGSYQVAPTTVVRAGYNKASNPVPVDTLHYLFPAIQVSHYTLGVGHAFSKSDSVDFAVTMAPKHTSDMGADAEVSMAQTNWQFMYSKKF